MARLRIIVVGGGVMGMATGCALAGRGADVTVLERFAVGHEWASSHGLTRAIRHEYGPAEIYTRMVARSLALWNDLAHETGRHLYTETGVLALGQEDDGETLAGYEVMRAQGLPVERLTTSECQQRFPPFVAGEYSAITYNPTGGMLHASECLIALSERFKQRGGELRESSHVLSVAAEDAGVAVTMEDGNTLSADRVVVTAGPWVRTVLPDLSLPVRATRQQVCYLTGLPPEQFAVGTFPVFLAGMNYYGFPLQGVGWFKVGAHITGPSVDPNVPYAPDMHEVEDVRQFLRRVIPAAAGADLALVDRCMYDMSPDEDFILDRHPASANIIVGSGFSGHGFKFGILIGELLAALALDEKPEFSLERFRLSRFEEQGGS
jgi:monomeric sarcosine oxidase